MDTTKDQLRIPGAELITPKPQTFLICNSLSYSDAKFQTSCIVETKI
jgi:hypothetical protein